jgi:hypothetical protein
MCGKGRIGRNESRGICVRHDLAEGIAGLVGGERKGGREVFMPFIGDAAELLVALIPSSTSMSVVTRDQTWPEKV